MRIFLWFNAGGVSRATQGFQAFGFFWRGFSVIKVRWGSPATKPPVGIRCFLSFVLFLFCFSGWFQRLERTVNHMSASLLFWGVCLVGLGSIDAKERRNAAERC